MEQWTIKSKVENILKNYSDTRDSYLKLFILYLNKYYWVWISRIQFDKIQQAFWEWWSYNNIERICREFQKLWNYSPSEWVMEKRQKYRESFKNHYWKNWSNEDKIY